MSRRTDLRRIVAIGLVVVASALAAPGVRAEQDPNRARGFSPGELYDFSGIDSINLFNGGLNVTIPIGPRYPVGDSLSYGLTLSYSSSTWEPEEVEILGDRSIVMHPRKSANAGHGWMLSLAGNLYDRPGPVGESAGFEFESADGSEHLFYHSLHQMESDPCFFTRDNTYLKLCTAPSRTEPHNPNDPNDDEVLERYTLEFPDGTKQTYEEIPVADRLSDWDHERYQVVRIEDRLGNSVTVEYERVLFNMTWTVADSAGRSHTVELSRQLVDGQNRWRANRANLAKFGSGTAQYQFVYETAPIDRSCKSNPNSDADEEFPVPLLREVALPAGAGSYRMPSYNSQCSLGNWPDAPLGDLPGTLARLDLPTGGRLEWTYRDHIFLVDNPDDPVRRMLERSTGVSTKRMLDASGGCESGPLSACTWTYASFSYSGLTRVMRVVNPAGDRSEHYFRQRRRHEHEPMFVGWDYGLPMSADHSHQGLFLSSQVFEGHGNPVLRREVYVSYEHDQLIASLMAEEDWRNSNRRTVAERTLYHDDTYQSSPGVVVPRFSETRHEDFDGLGHYRETTRSGDFGTAGVAAWHRTTTTYNPARGTYAIDQATNGPTSKHTYVPFPSGSPWVLGTYTSTRAEQPGSAVASQFCFDGATGRLLRRRALASAAGPGTADVIVVQGRNRQSDTVIHYEELSYGGDLQAVGTGALCSLGLPSGPVYRTRHTHRYGVPATTEPLQPGGGTLNLRTLDLAIDQQSGLPSSSIDPAGLTTNYGYDAFGRLVSIRPETGGDGWTDILYSTAAGTTPAKVTVTRRPNGSAGGTVLEQSRFVYDPFGRVRRDERQIAGHGWTAVETGTNAMGWKTFVTERGPAPGSLPHKTWFLQHDAFGRPQRIELPDYPADGRHWVKLSYNGARLVTREVSIGSDLAGGEIRRSTTEITDHLGRLTRVQEPSGPGGASRNADYGYDAAGRLTTVRLEDAGFAQGRDFVYDGRGFLTSERHPENGWTFYARYDPRGHAGRKRNGPVQGPFDVQFVYDAAERLTFVREWIPGSTGRLLKEFAYGTGTAAADRSNNKIRTAIRHNHVLNPSTGNSLDVVVTETYTYGGVGGRASKRTTGLSTGQGFTQEWSYDALGAVASIDYPTCTHGGAVCGTTAGKRPRTVGFIRSLGYLTAVPGWASSISYHANGMLNQVVHANGVTYAQGLDPHWMRRPGSLSVTHPNHVLALAEGESGLLAAPLAYTYDGAGNVKSWAEEEYRYDPVSRILAGRLGGNQIQTYSYDQYGNILSITTNRGTGPQTVTLGVDRTTNRLSAATYDDAGNLTSRGLYGYGYDALSMMQTMAGGGLANTYIYTADDERIWSIDATVAPWRETFTLRDLDGKALRVFTTSTGANALSWSQDYVHRDGQLLATARVNGAGETRHHFHLNHLGTPLLITRPDGGTEALHTYFPFGEELNPDADTEPMKYTGHERDLNKPGQADDLDYMHARFCSPLLGRFLSVDPVLGRPETPQSWNRYAYVVNNPLKYIDPTGEAMTGGQIADSLEGGIDEIEEDLSASLPPDAMGIVLDTLLGAGSDFGRGVADVLRLGEASGTAFGEGASVGETALAVGGDMLRAAAIAAPLAGAGRVAAGRAAASTATSGSKIIASNGTEITGFTRHGVNRAIGDGASRAGTRPEAILDALRNSDRIVEGADKLGRPFQVFHGTNARVVVNPQTGRIVSTNPLSRAGAH